MTKVEHFDAEGNLTGTSVHTTSSRWDEESRVFELAYTEYLDGLCECGVPRSVCMDDTGGWLVDFRTGYRCQAMAIVQAEQDKKDQEIEKAGGKTYPSARKWFTTPVSREDYGDDGQDGPG